MMATTAGRTTAQAMCTTKTNVSDDHAAQYATWCMREHKLKPATIEADAEFK